MPILIGGINTLRDTPCRHSYIPVTPTRPNLNRKIDPFMLHLNNVFIQAKVLPAK